MAQLPSTQRTLRPFSIVPSRVLSIQSRPDVRDDGGGEAAHAHPTRFIRFIRSINTVASARARAQKWNRGLIKCGTLSYSWCTFPLFSWDEYTSIRNWNSLFFFYSPSSRFCYDCLNVYRDNTCQLPWRPYCSFLFILCLFLADFHIEYVDRCPWFMTSQVDVHVVLV